MESQEFSPEKKPTNEEKREDNPEKENSNVIALADTLFKKLSQGNDTLAKEPVRDYLVNSVKFLLEEASLQNVENFLNKILMNEEFVREVQAIPFLISDLYQIYQHQEIFDDPQKLSNFICNIKLYLQEHKDSYLDTQKRIQENPVATKEELDAGVYKEALESQVRDAVFAMRAKGYNTFESGFGDYVLGEQYMGFDKAGIDKLPEIPKELITALTSKNISISCRELKDRYQLILIPEADLPSLEEWKEIWKIVSDLIPPVSKNVSPQNEITNLSRRFREEQEKLRREK